MVCDGSVWGGGVGDLYILLSRYFLLLISTSIVIFSNVFSVNEEKSG